MESFTIQHEGVDLACVRAGHGGVPLLLVHGFTGSKEDFAHEEFGNQVDRLAGLGFDALAVDHRGHGLSTHPPDEADYSLEIFAADMWSVVDQLGWDRFDLLGHSMGGMIVQVMAVDRPERINRLVLMDTHHGGVNDLNGEIVATGQELARTQGLAVVRALLEAFTPIEDRAAYERICSELPAFREWSNQKMERCSPAMYAQMLGVFESMTDRSAALATLPMPTLVMVGELDSGFMDASLHLAEVIPNAELVILPGGGHSPQFEARQAWEAALDAFLKPSLP